MAKEALERLWAHVLERPAGAALAALGGALIVFGMVMYVVNESATTLSFVALGVLAIPLGALLPRLERAEIGATGGKLWFGKLPADTQRSLDLAISDDVDPDDVDEPAEIVIAARHSLAGESLRAIMQPAADDPLAGVYFRLYLYDEDLDRLIPVTLPGEAPSDVELHAGEEWEVGKGATGTAFADDTFVYVAGDAVWDTTYGLTDAQAERFRSLTVVASIPVLNLAGDTIAVLTASTELPDGGAIGTEDDAFYELLARSMLVARVLIDLLGWAEDRYPSLNAEGVQHPEGDDR